MISRLSQISSDTGAILRDWPKYVGFVDYVMLSCGDFVFAIHSPYWPEVANEWITRYRQSGSPSRTTIKKVVRYGCDFVHSKHKLSHNPAEWRFSFSQAEMIIIHNWTRVQRMIYHTLRRIYKSVQNNKGCPNLCTYYFKTLMLWAAENKPERFWNSSNLIASTCELLMDMMSQLDLKFLQNYFIPDNNIMDHLVDIDTSADISALNNILQQSSTFAISECLLICRASGAGEWINTTTKCLKCPRWIKNGLLMSNRVNNPFDSEKDLFKPLTQDRGLNSMLEELFDIHKAISFLRSAIGCISYKRYQLMYQSEQHLTISTSLCHQI